MLVRSVLFLSTSQKFCGNMHSGLKIDQEVPASVLGSIPAAGDGQPEKEERRKKKKKEERKVKEDDRRTARGEEDVWRLEWLAHR